MAPLAAVGGTDFNSSQFDPALAGAGRPPGSAFKVFTLVTALEQGMSPNEIVDGSTPCRIPNPGGTPNPWTPENFEGEAFGRLSLTDAIRRAVGLYVEGKQSEADFAARAEAALEEIEREATARRNAITPDDGNIIGESFWGNEERDFRGGGTRIKEKVEDKVKEKR